MKDSISRVKLYFDWIVNLLESDPRVIFLKIQRERASSESGFIQISIKLINEKRLEIFEYYSVSQGTKSYRYQIMDKNNQLIARWATAPHHPEIITHPYHLHHDGKIHESEKMTVNNLLKIIDGFI